jgi:Nup85 Nucleoporin
MSSTKPTRTTRAMAWDPTSPATLLLPTVDSTTAAKDGAFRLDMFLSHDGVGCNSHESSALMNILDAHEAYLSSKTGSWKSLKALSTAYRKALWNCLRGWEEDLGNTDNGGDGGGDDYLESSRENMELLKIIYAVTHLSEVFLLLPPSNSALDYYEHTAYMPGAVTADLVRYLRFHHMSDPYASVEPDPNVLEEVLESMHPDQAGGDGAIYWKLVETLLIRGCLEDVWSLLSRHSIFRRSLDVSVESLDEYHAATLNEDREGFFALRALLLSAPLPGGRNDLHDAAFDYAGDDNNDEEEGAEDDELLEGIPLSGYRMWETGRMDSGDSAAGDVPHSFNPHAASQKFQTWTQHLNTLTAVHKLKRRIPQIEIVLSILSGNLKNVEFESWAENFCAELLYKLRTLRPDDMHTRASRIMEKFGVTLKGSMEETVLSVMKGNAGRVVEVVYNMGGGSGAALPSVMVSRTCNSHVVPVSHFLTLYRFVL